MGNIFFRTHEDFFLFSYKIYKTGLAAVTWLQSDISTLRLPDVHSHIHIERLSLHRQSLIGAAVQAVLPPHLGRLHQQLHPEKEEKPSHGCFRRCAAFKSSSPVLVDLVAGVPLVKHHGVTSHVSRRTHNLHLLHLNPAWDKMRARGWFNLFHVIRRLFIHRVTFLPHVRFTWCAGHRLPLPSPSKCWKTHLLDETGLWSVPWLLQNNLCNAACEEKTKISGL